MSDLRRLDREYDKLSECIDCDNCPYRNVHIGERYVTCRVGKLLAESSVDYLGMLHENIEDMGYTIDRNDIERMLLRKIALEDRPWSHSDDLLNWTMSLIDRHGDYQPGSPRIVEHVNLFGRDVQIPSSDLISEYDRDSMYPDISIDFGDDTRVNRIYDAGVGERGINGLY